MSRSKQPPMQRHNALTPATASVGSLPRSASQPGRSNHVMARLFRAAKEDEPCPECAGKLQRQASPGNGEREALSMGEVAGPSKKEECGETGRPSSFEHMLIEQDFMLNVDPNSAMEYGIPRSSAKGNKGYADILSFTMPSVFEIKSVEDDLAEARDQVRRYRYFGSLHCPGLEDLDYGTYYPSPRVIQGLIPGTQLVIELIEPGLLVYSRQGKLPDPVPVPVPKEQTDEEKEKQRDQLKEILVVAGIAAAVIAAVVVVLVAAPYVALVLAEVVGILVKAGVEAGIAWGFLRQAGLVATR